MATTAEVRGTWTRKEKNVPKPVIQRANMNDDLNFEIDPKAMQEIMSDKLPQADDGKNSRQTIAGNYSPPKPPMSARRSSLFGGAMRVKAPGDGSKRQAAMTPSRMMAKPKIISSATKTPRARTGHHTGVSDSIHLNFDDCPDFLVAAAASGLAGAKTPSKLAPSAGASRTPGRQLHTKSFAERLDKENHSSLPNATNDHSSTSEPRCSFSPKIDATTATIIARTQLLIDLDDDIAPSPKKAEAKYFPIVHVDMPALPPKTQSSNTSIFDLPEFNIPKPSTTTEVRKPDFSLFSPIRPIATTYTIKTSMTPKPMAYERQEKLVDDIDSTIVIEPTALQRASTAPAPSTFDLSSQLATSLTIELAQPSSSTTVVKVNSAPPTPLPTPTISKVKLLQTSTESVGEQEEVAESSNTSAAAAFTERLKAIAHERQTLLNMMARLQEEENLLIANFIASNSLKLKENDS